MKEELTQRQAWLKIARAYKKFARTEKRCGLTKYGLCFAVKVLSNGTSIAYEGTQRMFCDIAKYRREHVLAGPRWFPFTCKHALKRAEIARQFAEEAE